MTTNGGPASEGGLAGFLEPHSISGGIGKDAALLKRAIREEWGVPPEVRTATVARMKAVMGKASVAVPAGDGVFESEAQADRNAIAAAGVLLTMTAQNQRERHHAEDLEQADRHHAEGQTVHQTSDVRVLMVDATGQTKTGHFDDIRRIALGAADPAPQATGSGEQQGPEPGGNGGATGG